MPWSTSTRRSRLPSDWRKRRLIVLRRDKGQCQIKGPDCTRMATEVDHVIPNDDHSLTNLQAACHVDHAAKTALEAAAAKPSRLRPSERHPGLL